MTLPTAVTRDRAGAIVAVLLVVIAVVLGGGGTPAPLAELAVELATGLAAAIWLVLRGAAWPESIPPALKWLICVVVAVPIAQLVPLPPGVWHAFPGRGIEREALALIGDSETWRPLSLVPHRTFAALLALGPPLVLLAMAAALPVGHRQWIIVAIVACGLGTVVLGAAQLAGGDTAYRLYSSTHVGWLTGFQANRNATADVLLIAILACAALGQDRGRTGNRQSVLHSAVLTLLGLGVVLTGSRAGIVLLLPVVVVALVMTGGFASLSRRGSWLLGGAVAVLGTLLVIGVRTVPVLGAVAARFGLTGDFRRELWIDTWNAIGQTWPIGGGVGSFVPLLLTSERLEVVDPTMPNRAHNDYLEFLLEAGAIAPVVLAVCLYIVVRTARDGSSARAVPRKQVLFALGTLGVIAAHSIVDYPVRSLSLACLLGAAVGMVFPPVAREGEV